MGKCQEGVCVTVDDRFFSVSPDTVDGFFENEIKGKSRLIFNQPQLSTEKGSHRYGIY